LGWRRTHERDEEVVVEPPAGSPEDGVVPGLVFVRVPEGKRDEPRTDVGVAAVAGPRSIGDVVADPVPDRWRGGWRALKT
jgi:hypothetical protein